MQVAHPHAFRPLADLQSLTALCHVCGYGVRLDKRDLAKLTAVRSFGHLMRKAFCPPCQKAGVTRLNMVLHTDWDMAPLEPRTIIIGRSPEIAQPPQRPGPFEHLPRRVLFRDRRVRLFRRVA